MKYTECEKMKEVQEDSQKIGEFLDWLQNDKQVILSRYYDDVECEHCEESTEQLLSIRLGVEELLSEYYEIDLNKVEEERQHMLKQLNKGKK